MKRIALIVGAGIGGLSAAIALRQVVWTVRLFEGATRARELGFGLLVAPNTIVGLRRLGVAGIVLAHGFAPTWGELHRMDGTVLKHWERESTFTISLTIRLRGSVIERKDFCHSILATSGAC